jgi:hypothetical protein
VRSDFAPLPRAAAMTQIRTYLSFIGNISPKALTDLAFGIGRTMVQGHNM